MKFNTKSPLVFLCLIFTIITLFSCSKDSDLMADYVALDPDIGTIARFVANDSYLISISDNPEDDTFEIIVNNNESSETSAGGSNGTTVDDSYQISSDVSIILDVLANDTFENKEGISIIETSQPNNGNVVINEDNTLTYTPEEILAAEPVTDTFTYTAEVQNNDGTVTSGEANVNIIIESNASRSVSNISPWDYCQDGNPIGGGAGYDAIVTTGTHIVSTNLSASAFEALVEARTSGDVVFINGDVTIDLTALGSGQITVPEGVTIASDRGHNGSLGALVFTDHMQYLNNGGNPKPVFRTTGSNTRFTGFRFKGPFGGRGDFCASPDQSCRRIKWGISSNYDNTEVDNMEGYNWPYGFVTLSTYGGNSEYFGPNQPSTGHLIHHNYIHNNQQNSFGYGVNVSHATATVYANLFQYQRHDIAGIGDPIYNGYEAYCNTILPGGSHHNFDMHAEFGSSVDCDRRGISGTECNPRAGLYVNIHHNDFQDVGASRSSSINNWENIRISGIPVNGTTVEYNRFAHSAPFNGTGANDRVAFKQAYVTGNYGTLTGVTHGNNTYDGN